MTVNSYLTNLAGTLVLKDTEKENIGISISTISSRISSYFSNQVREHFRFGSSTRGTILPRQADDRSDIDYMVVFNTFNGTSYKPQTYLDQLKRFVERYYSTSEIHQSHPAIVLELNHIKFELVPSTLDLWSQYQIPSPVNANSWNEWLVTDPNRFNQILTNANIAHNSHIKPLVRLVKYWNSLNGCHFSSYDLENFIVMFPFSYSSNLKDYFYGFWDSFSCSYNTAQYIKDKVQRTKDKVVLIRQYEQQGYVGVAESEIAKLLPVI